MTRENVAGHQNDKYDEYRDDSEDYPEWDYEEDWCYDLDEDMNAGSMFEDEEGTDGDSE